MSSANDAPADAAAHKRGHRSAMGERRAALDLKDAGTAAERLRDHFLLHPLVRALAPGPVLVPVRHRGEIDTEPLCMRLSEQGWTVCRPRLRGTTLEPVPAPPGTPLVPGYGGVLEPAAQLPALPPDVLHLVVVPGLAFDRAGHRIGYGGGFFDRFLPTVGAATTIGIGYRFQLLDEPIRSEAHDVAMHGLQLEDLALLPEAPPAPPSAPSDRPARTS